MTFSSSGSTLGFRVDILSCSSSHVGYNVYLRGGGGGGGGESPNDSNYYSPFITYNYDYGQIGENASSIMIGIFEMHL